MIHFIAADSPPAGLFRHLFRRETEKGLLRPGAPEIYTVLDLDLPDGTVRWARQGISAGGYQYEPRVLTFGSVKRGVPLRTNDLASVEIEVQIIDTDRTFARKVASYRNSLRRSPATIRYVSPNVPEADSPVRFDGILDSYDQQEPFLWTLRLRPDDLALEQGEIPRKVITEIDWPASDPEVRGAYWPIVLGEHDSAGITAEGMLPTYHVDTVGHRYLVGIGKNQVPAVYADGEVVSLANYSITYPIVNGTQATLVDFTADQGTASITVDCLGMTDTGETSGTVVRNPARQVELLLRLFVFSDWRSGDYPSSAQIEYGLLEEAAAYFDLHGYEGAKYFGGDTQVVGRDALNEWATSNRCKVFWTNRGRLGLRVLAHTKSPDHLYQDEQWLRGDEDGAQFSMPIDALNLVRGISAEHLLNEVDGGYAQTLLVEDLSVADDVTESLQLPWAARRLT